MPERQSFIFPFSKEGRRFLSDSSDLPGSPNGASRSSSPIWSCSTWGLPCQRPLPAPRCALTAPFHPYPPKYTTGGIVFCGTFRKTRFERVLPAVSRHAALWRPDFPPANLFLKGPRATVHPASSTQLSGVGGAERKGNFWETKLQVAYLFVIRYSGHSGRFVFLQLRVGF